MPSYEVTKLFDKRPWEGSEGSKMVAHEIEVKDGEGFQRVDVHRPEGVPGPRVGDTFNGTIKFGSRGATLKVDKAPGGGSKGSGGGYGKSPEERAEIRRSVAQKAAVALLAVEVQAGLKFESVKASELLTPRIEFFAKDLEQSAKA